MRYADTTLTLDLAAVVANYRMLSAMASAAQTAAVVKADAYGIGATQVAQALSHAGCRMFFVAHLDEAIALRKTCTHPIAVFHGLRAKQEKIFQRYDLIPVLNTVDELRRWNKAASRAEKKLPAILHVDTGMNRLGISLEEAEKIAADATTRAGIELRYVMSHMACLSTPDHPMNSEQLRRFNQVRHLFPGIPASLSNSAGVMTKSCYHFDLVRPGCSLYGIQSVEGQPSPLKQVAHLYAPIIQIRNTTRDEAVGYGATHTVPKGTTLVTLPVGYADGYLRSLSNHAFGYVEDIALPLVGRVSMDLVVLDATRLQSHPKVKEILAIGSRIELLGKHAPVDMLAEQAGTIGYEILTSLGARYKRIYRNPE